ncbi:MAG: CBS domain-containing protein [Longimicrobiales bacterium]|nr:CBS domain-containing protein [Longimicrobiales bacterium]
MALYDWLSRDRIRCPASGDTLGAVLAELLAAHRGGSLAPSSPTSGGEGAGGPEAVRAEEVVRLADATVAVVREGRGIDRPVVYLGVSAAPFALPVEGDSEVGGAPGSPTPASPTESTSAPSAAPPTARVAFLVLVPDPSGPVRIRVLSELRRLVAREGVMEDLLAAASPEAVLALPALGDHVPPSEPTLSDAIRPLRYRVFPETPLSELVDLMVRRSLHAVPVVGEEHEVLGIVTTGDVLGHLVDGPRSSGAERPRAARDVMTRAVLCVSEGQALAEVARLMVSRDVEQLPVVRDGQLVGFVTRDSVLHSLFTTPEAPGSD